MKKDVLITIWQDGNREMVSEDQTDRETINRYLSAKTLKGTRSIHFNLVFYAIIILVSIILLSMNLSGYQNNPRLIWVLVSQLLISIGILVFSIEIFYRIRVINNYSNTLMDLIEKQLWFFRRPYEIWQLLAALSAIILIINLNLFIDNDNGSYVIYHKGVFVFVTLGVFLFIYGAQKLSSFLGLRNLKAYLSDLQQGNLEKSQQIERSRKKYLWLWILIFLLLTATFIVGLISSLG